MKNTEQKSDCTGVMYSWYNVAVWNYVAELRQITEYCRQTGRVSIDDNRPIIEGIEL